jgi:hypothetical protein
MSRFVPTIVSRVRPRPEEAVVGSEGEPQRSSISSGAKGKRAAGYEEAISAEKWQMLCHFLGLSLAEALALPGPELLRLTFAEIKRRDLRKRGYQL